MSEYHHKTNACQNCCKTGKSMAEHIKKLEAQNKKLKEALEKNKSLIENIIHIHSLECIGSTLCHVDLNCMRCILDWCVKINKEALERW